MAKKKPQNKDAQDALKKEIASLGRKVEDAFQAAAQNEKLRNLTSELSEGVRRVGTKLADAVTAAKESEQGKAVRENLRANLSSGLRVLGKELSKLAEKLDK